MAPWANGIDKPIRQIVRGLARFWKQKTDTTVFSTPFGVALDLAKEPIGILAFDGSFVKDFSKEAERFGERFEQVLKDPSSENNWKGNESKARDWLSGESRRVHLFAAALDKSSGPDGLVVESKVWDFGVLPRTK
ncbi:MAG: hypothetical protein HYV07_34235 [Deltaproteobacteria bacterium]|nr:hypothetical protein [Deltaproteobacteria bacterium]